MLLEDNNGFVHFPVPSRLINRNESGKTFVYLVAFEAQDVANNPYILSNTRILNPGILISDDMNMSIDSTQDNEFYFKEGKISIPMTTAICIGWSDYTFDSERGNWYATFRDLTPEGRKLYYSIKKLHNNKDVRVLTFNKNSK
jgi:hypothetical protein